MEVLCGVLPHSQSSRIAGCKLPPFLHRVVLVHSCKHVILEEKSSNLRSEKGRERPTFERAAAISKVPTVSMLEAIMGTPLNVILEFLNINSLWRSTYRETTEGGTKPREEQCRSQPAPPLTHL